MDKYNLLYAYKPSSSCGHQNLHKTAAHIVLVAALHLQLGTLLFTIVRGGKGEGEGEGGRDGECGKTVFCIANGRSKRGSALCTLGTH